MKTVTRVTITDDTGEKFFGEGPDRLLRAVEREGSLLKAAKSMEMAYSKAIRLIENAEKALGYPLLSRTTGGRSGGGSTLTEAAEEFLQRYEMYRDAVRTESEKLFRQYFPEDCAEETDAAESGDIAPGLRPACVIMASGLSVRFGRNKLMADFGGEPLIGRILRTTEGLFEKRVCVTRTADTADYLKSQGIETVFHDLPGRNDTVRLGLEKIMEIETDGCLFCPADQPLLKRETVRRILQAAAEHPEKIIRPEAEGTPGAPVWFPKSLYPELLTLPEGKGGGVLIRKYPDRVLTVEANPEELADADTEEEFERMIKSFAMK